MIFYSILLNNSLKVMIIKLIIKKNITEKIIVNIIEKSIDSSLVLWR